MGGTLSLPHQIPRLTRPYSNDDMPLAPGPAADETEKGTQKLSMHVRKTDVQTKVAVCGVKTG